VAWQRVRLELARSHDFPEGSYRHGYEIVLPLTPLGQIDYAALEKAPELCTVHRFWSGEGDSVGQIVHEGDNWTISYDEGEDEVLLHFADHRFREGEYIAVRDARGDDHAFRIVKVRPEPGLAPSTA
jgi:hypothetical protein